MRSLELPLLVAFILWIGQEESNVSTKLPAGDGLQPKQHMLPDAPPARVWEALTPAQSYPKCLPGCPVECPSSCSQAVLVSYAIEADPIIWVPVPRVD